MLSLLDTLTINETEQLRKALVRTSLLTLSLWLFFPDINFNSGIPGILSGDQSIDISGKTTYILALAVLLTLFIRYFHFHRNAIRELYRRNKEEEEKVSDKREKINVEFSKLIARLEQFHSNLQAMKEFEENFLRASQEFHLDGERPAGILRAEIRNSLSFFYDYPELMHPQEDERTVKYLGSEELLRATNRIATVYAHLDQMQNRLKSLDEVDSKVNADFVRFNDDL